MVGNFGAGPAAGGREGAVLIRVLTFNIRGGLGMDGRRSTARIAEVVAAQSPDVVCLQEVHQRLPWSGFVDQPRRLKKSLGLSLVFQRNINTALGGYGVAIATRLPILSTRRHFLPSVGERRGALEVTIQTPTGPLSLWCTHWGLREDEREQQAAQMAAWLATLREPVIVCGDCNERADAPALRRLLAGTGLQDADAQADTPTYPADFPTARIDFILASSSLPLEGCRVLDTRVSDHRPVIADFTTPA